MEHLYEELMAYSRGEDYPLHMPGHKRRLTGDLPPQLFELDITEIDGFDDLHHPEGILARLQERAARLYGAEESYCLVNGSTCGILSAISAAVPMGGQILIARNCHKSVYHGAYLRNLKVSYLVPPVREEFGICEGVEAEQVRAALEENQDIAAVLIVSPTYEGRIAPVREIAEVVHGFGKILIVDEAHGAHLGLAPCMPENSCMAGADLVIHSVHKTLPSLTQTALLHVNGPRVDRHLLGRFLRIYQSSSPSYLLLSSIDNAMTILEREGQERLEAFCREFGELTDELASCRHLRILKEEKTDRCLQDVGKLVIHTGDSGLSGKELYDLLRERYRLQPEMAAGDYVLAMFTVGDSPEGYLRVKEALLEIDHSIREEEAPRQSGAAVGNRELPECVYPVAQAWDAPSREWDLEEAPGKMAAEFVNLYPPGVPLLVPGERIDQRTVEEILHYLEQGLNVQGIRAGHGIMCIQE